MTAVPDPGSVVDATAAWERLVDVRTAHDARAASLLRDPDGGWRWPAGSSGEAAQLADLYLPLCLAGTRHVYAQLGQSLDGCIATRTGDACFVTGEADRRHLHRLRALADAVVVGAGTALADDPQLTVRDVPGPSPVRVVLDRGGRVPTNRRAFTDGAAPTLWVLDRDAPAYAAPPDGVEILRLGCGGDGGFVPRDLLDALAERGLGRVLVEGGGVTVSRFLQAGALHRLYLTVAPVVVGDGLPGVRFPGSDRMCNALRPPVRRFVLGEDVLFELDLASSAKETRGLLPAAVDWAPGAPGDLSS